MHFHTVREFGVEVAKTPREHPHPPPPPPRLRRASVFHSPGIDGQRGGRPPAFLGGGGEFKVDERDAVQKSDGDD